MLSCSSDRQDGENCLVSGINQTIWRRRSPGALMLNNVWLHLIWWRKGGWAHPLWVLLSKRDA
jgi:hypothetical protein